MPGQIALFGSGELSDSMAEVHRSLMSHLDEPVRPVFIDTPAGFELNIERIDQKAITYFERNFGLPLALARYRSTTDSVEHVAAAVTTIRGANYIFAGPGSASYAIRMWRDSPVWRAVIERWQAGAMLAFASAAALTLGAFTIPVYEIYKVGAETNWIAGLDVLGTTGLNAAVVPHWNNNSGDQSYDTRYCFMGAPRLAVLEAQLPDDVMMLGIDEYTAACIDPNTKQVDVLGAGEVTLRRKAHQQAYGKNQHFDLMDASAALPDVTPADATAETPAAADEQSDVKALRASAEAAISGQDWQAAVSALVTLSLIAGAALDKGIYNRAEGALQALQALLPALIGMQPRASGDDASEGLMMLLMDLRAELRTAKQWALADRLREGLTKLGYTLADSPAGTTWTRTS